MVRKSVRRNTTTFKIDYGGFCGWSKVQKIIKDIDDVDTKNIFMGLLKTGCRAMELPTLKKRHFNLNFSDTQIMVQGMYVEKQKDAIPLIDDNGNPILKNGKRTYTFESKEGYRTFPIRKDEPLSTELIDYVKKTPNDNDVLFPYTYGQIYYRIAMIQNTLPGGTRPDWYNFKGPWWPHRIRSERACQLIRDLHYDIFRLKKWFGWSSSQMPELYGGMVPMDLIDDRAMVWR